MSVASQRLEVVIFVCKAFVHWTGDMVHRKPQSRIFHIPFLHAFALETNMEWLTIVHVDTPDSYVIEKT